MGEKAEHDLTSGKTQGQLKYIDQSPFFALVHHPFHLRHDKMLLRATHRLDGGEG